MDVDISPTVSLHSMIDELHVSGVNKKEEIIRLTTRLDEIPKLEFKLKAIRICLGPALDALELDDLESTIFCHILPYSHQLFIKMLKDIELEVERNCVGSIINLLQGCCEILSCCENTLQQVVKFEPLKYENVSSLPINIASIVLNSFEHCRKSDIIYGENLSNITEVLTALFHKTCDVQNNLLAFLTNGVKFHCLFDDELQCLLEVMDVLEKCGETLMCLGIKPLVQQWKGYAQLASVYKDTFQTSLDVSKPICFLADDLGQRLLKTLQIQGNDIEGWKQVMKELKIGAFVLKIIVKLCEQYSGYLGNCHNELVLLLVRLYGISKPFSNVIGTPNEIVDFIERNITVGVGPLISALLEDRAFIEAIRSFNLSPSADADKSQRIGQLLLCAALMKKLIANDKEILQMWIKTGVSFVHIIFDLIENGSIDFELDLKLESTDFPGTSDLYETVLTHTTAYLLTSTTEQSFGQLEKFLESKIIQRKYWVALMASDIFLILSRFGSSDLKLNQAKYFLSRSVLWPSDAKHTPEWIFLSNFTHRLIKLIPLEVARDLLADYPPSVWAELGCGSIPGSTGIDVDRASKSLQRFLTNSDGIPECSDFSNMIGELLCLPSLQTDIETKYKNLLPTLAKLWQLCEHLSFSNEKQLGYWFDRLLVDLTSSSSNLLILMDNSLIIVVLRTLQQALKRNSASSKIISIEFLRFLAHVELKTDNSLTQVFKSIASLFSNLIEDTDPIISSNALECFEYFANVTLHSRIISLTGQQSSSTQNHITSYLQRSFMSSDGILQLPKNFECIEVEISKHKCAVNTVSKSSITINSSNNYLSNSVGQETCLTVNDSKQSNESSNAKLISLKNRLNKIIEKTLQSNEQHYANEKSECNLKFIIERLEHCIAECLDKVNE